ncbi:hypothetical protein [Variovorax sp. 770b2]|uniref:hypothetical protein n=1 Tax=Variovorax sp. 770b2 TaxID=1566271 RepID=UPI0008F1F653|nr:hypothetical protein [Variovorax sp. 770b2]SFP38274.1 hypothetical protein SAMN03159339_2035 [Variovorax sp. 770b2]
MANSSILGGERPPVQPKGKDTGALGPSDSSDSGSDVQAGEPRTALPDDLVGGGAYAPELATDTDAAGTGERASADEGVATDADLLPDRTGVLPDSAAEVRDAAGEEDSVRAADLAAEHGDLEEGIDEDEESA